MTDEQQEEVVDINEQIAIRRAKLGKLRDKNQAYPNDFKRDHLAACLHAKFGEVSAEELEQQKIQVKIAGRMVGQRLMGKASFAHVQDMSGKMQVYVRKNNIGELYDEFKEWDLGDIIGFEGELFKTKTGELTVKASNCFLLTKSLRPLPGKFHGLSDQETKYRQRYLDLIANEKTRQNFKIRTQLIQAIRDFLVDAKFVEVETPMMQPIPGGAAARPFVTHHNALDIPLYLRIAPELYLKRLVVGGVERVFEINRNFRNEGLSTRHNPEFTMLEFYQAYADFNDLMDFTEQMLRNVAGKVLGTTKVIYQDQMLDFEKPFTRMTVEQAILQYNPEFDKDKIRDIDYLRGRANELDINIHDQDGLGKIQIEIFEKTVEDKLLDPTFITAYPTEVSPLARRNDHDDFITDRFEFFVAGREIANGFSELNDPDDQAKRFKSQVEKLQKGDLEAMHYDEDYITALEYGMPPTAGEGIGIDRLAMLFTNATTIRDVILFPHMRPKS